MNTTVSSLPQVLLADGPAPDRAAAMALYGQFVGSWELEIHDFEADGTKRVSRGEWHFGWVLEGRAIQDVFIVPARAERGAPLAPGQRVRYGTTLRVYDPASDTWRITWINPVNQAHTELVGRRQGETIVQEGRDEDGLNRWTFADLTADSFTWRGEFSADGGATWRRGAEFFARRIAPR